MWCDENGILIFMVFLPKLHNANEIMRKILGKFQLKGILQNKSIVLPKIVKVINNKVWETVLTILNGILEKKKMSW